MTADDVNARASQVRFIVMDGDGVLTDGRILMAPDGSELKSFHARDGLAVRLGQRAGLEFGLVSGRRSAAMGVRAEELDFVEIHQKVSDKRALFEAIVARRGLEPQAVACIGDDLVDVPMLRLSGLACVVPEAPREVRDAAHFVTSAPGGAGAVREVIELVLKARGDWPGIVAAYGVEP